MITLFTVPKAFQGHTAVIQRNAIQSWLAMGRDIQIILCGNDPGVQQIAEQFKIDHLPDIQCSEQGTPLLDSVFQQAEANTRHDRLCYINTDIILFPQFLELINAIPEPQAMVIGQRWNLDWTTDIDFTDHNWQNTLQQAVTDRGKLEGFKAIDYFAYPKGAGIDQMPPFAIGRGAWDQWILFRAKQVGLTLIDATAMITAIHQNHDYAHIQAQQKDQAKNKEKAWAGPEADRNTELAGGEPFMFNLFDADARLEDGKLVPNLSAAHYVQQARHQAVLNHNLGSWRQRINQCRANLVQWSYLHLPGIPGGARLFQILSQHRRQRERRRSRPLI